MSSVMKTSYVNGEFVVCQGTEDILENINPSNPSEIVDRLLVQMKL
ncbi:hypothetical protein ACFSHO_10350 [Acinetobacter vivianii]